jgi:hypothetical protein
MINMQEKIDKLVYLIQQSELDDTIKDILIRDLQAEGLTDFLREQIKAYCLAGIKKMDEKIASAKEVLNSAERQTPV